MAYQLAFDLNENAPQEFLLYLSQQMEEIEVKGEEGSSADDDEKPTKSSEQSEALMRILSGEETIKHHMQFLIKNNHTDMLILKQLKDASRGTCTNNAVVIANGLMHNGTTCDDFLRFENFIQKQYVFLRDNLDWISKATNWNKFNAVASLGLIHKV